MKLKSIAVSLLLCLTCASASAQDFSSYLAASRSFFDKRNQFEQKRAMPRLTDSDVAPLISTLSDSQRFLDGVDFATKDLNDLTAVCREINNVVAAYTFFDLKNQIDLTSSNLPLMKQKMRELMQKNMRSFQIELSLLQPFAIKCLAKTLATTVDFVKGLKPEEMTEVRIAGLRKLRGGIANAYIRLLEDSVDEGLGFQYKSALFKALAETSGTLQTILLRQEREKIIGAVRAMPSASQESFGGYFKDIETAMSSSQCVDLCAIE